MLKRTEAEVAGAKREAVAVAAGWGGESRGRAGASKTSGCARRRKKER